MSGLLSLGDATDLFDATYSGFTYDRHKQELPLIGNGTDSGNLVIQQTAKGYRKAKLTFIARDDDEKSLVQGYEEDSTEVTFTDYAGTQRTVEVIEFAASVRRGLLWDVSVTLLEISIAGS